jgi:hypothetical protein
MDYFKNESEVERIGNLQIENRLDRITLSGDLDITKDKQGEFRLWGLIEHLSGIATALKAEDIKGALPDVMAVRAPTEAGNIFGMPALDGKKHAS